MEIMQQSANHLDGRWRSHMLPYSGHTVSSLPNIHDHIRQQMISTQSDQQQQHLQHSGTSNDHLEQQQHPHSQQQLSPQMPPHRLDPSHRLDSQMQQHRQIIVEHQQRRDHPSTHSPSKEHQQSLISSSSSSRGGGSSGLPSPSLRLNSLTLQSSPSSASPSTPSTPSPPTPSPGKSSGKDGEEKKGEEWEQYNAGAAFLGPTLWDKTLSYDQDLKVSLEYMDLDEFLNENGIPIEESKRAAAANAANGGTSGGNCSVGLAASGNSLRPAQSPEAPSSPEEGAQMGSSPQMGSGMGACPQGASASSSMSAGGPLSVLPSPLSPQDYQDYGDCSTSVSSPGSPDPHSPLQVHDPGKNRASASGLLSSQDLLENLVPGQDFDPRTRCFSEEELKPQPMIKKSRKQFVPAELKDDKYWARRRKNNLAAKRSRDARRMKENQIAMRANFLEKENNAMTVELQKAQAIVESLKKRLAMYEAV